MTNPVAPEWDGLSRSTLELIGELTDQFKRAWQDGGPPPRIQDFLSDGLESEQLFLLRELVKIDREHRQRRNEPRSLAEYAREFPQLLSADPSLAAEVQAHETLPYPQSSPTPTPPPVDGTPANRASLPHKIGKYRVIDLLGEGGQAVVYRAIDPELNRMVVIKLSKWKAADEAAFAEAVRSEGRVLATLEHPALVRIYEYNLHEGYPYLVMEYVAGSDLESSVRHKPLTPRQAAQVAVKVAHALAFVHRHNIVHQDLKPKNILIDEFGQPRLVDFGLARLRHFWADPEVQPSGGTLAYISPEQARGEWDRVGPRSDVFALGGVLYFLLTGKPPFEAETFAQALEQAQKGQINRLALRKPGMPRRLAAICLRALSSDPAQRYDSAEQFAAELERFLRPPWLLILLGALACLFAIAALVRALWPTPIEPPPMEQMVIKLIGRQQRGGKLLRTTQSLDDLQRLMPLRQGDELRLECDLPRGGRPAVFWLDTSGDLQELDAIPVQAGDRLDHLKAMLPVRPGPRGVYLILVCANRRGKPTPTRDEIRQHLEAEGIVPLAPAELPLDFVYLLQREKVDFQGERPRGADPLNALMQVEDRLERLRLRLRDQTDYFWGVALPLQQ